MAPPPGQKKWGTSPIWVIRHLQPAKSDGTASRDKLPIIPQPHTQLLLTNQCDGGELTLSQVDKLKYKEMDSDDKWRISLILYIMNIKNWSL